MSAPLVACVLRTGGETFTEEWVTRLAAGVKHWDPDAILVALTDVERTIPGVDAQVELNKEEATWPGWWSKVALFRPGLFPGHQTVIYLDLDTLPFGSVAPLADWEGPGVAMLSDFFTPRIPASGVLLFRPGTLTENAYRTFRGDTWRIIRQNLSRSDHWYATVFPGAERIQNLFPGSVASTKLEARRGAPAGVRLVCAHGRPRFTEKAAGWAHAEWMRRAAWPSGCVSCGLTSGYCLCDDEWGGRDLTMTEGRTDR